MAKRPSPPNDPDLSRNRKPYSAQDFEKTTRMVSLPSHAEPDPIPSLERHAIFRLLLKWRQGACSIDVLRSLYIGPDWERDKTLIGNTITMLDTLDRTNKASKQIKALASKTEIAGILLTALGYQTQATTIAPNSLPSSPEYKSALLSFIAAEASEHNTASILTLARAVFENQEAAEGWLRRPNKNLDGMSPCEMLESTKGRDAVEQLLHRIAHGMAA